MADQLSDAKYAHFVPFFFFSRIRIPRACNYGQRVCVKDVFDTNSHVRVLREGKVAAAITMLPLPSLISDCTSLLGLATNHAFLIIFISNLGNEDRLLGLRV